MTSSQHHSGKRVGSIVEVAGELPGAQCRRGNASLRVPRPVGLHAHSSKARRASYVSEGPVDPDRPQLYSAAAGEIHIRRGNLLHWKHERFSTRPRLLSGSS
jgi:hypothetical protein